MATFDISGLGLDDDLFLAAPPAPPFDWIREGTSYWLFEENGAFGLPRIGVEAEPWTWENRRYQANLAFADGRVLNAMGVGALQPVHDDRGRPAILGGGPLTFECLEPFERWRIRFDGEAVDTKVAAQIARTVDRGVIVPLRYEVEVTMAAPPNVQDVSPGKFATWGKGKQRDAVSVGLGLRFEQVLRGTGELTIDGTTRSFAAVGSRIKRRSVRTDGLMLRGHCWQAATFPDGRAFGYEARPVHDEGFEPWNEAFVFQDGVMHYGKATRVPWLDRIVASGDDVSLEIETDLGTTRIAGTTGLSTFRIGNKDIWGLDLHQSGALYEWEGQRAWGMIERSAPSGR